jgi:hypothetical protein
VKIEGDVGVGFAEAGGGGLELGHSDGGIGVEELALEIGEIDRIGIDKAEAADPCRSKVEGGGRAEAAGADEEDGCAFQPQLSGLADLRDE